MVTGSNFEQQGAYNKPSPYRHFLDGMIEDVLKEDKDTVNVGDFTKREVDGIGEMERNEFDLYEYTLSERYLLDPDTAMQRARSMPINFQLKPLPVKERTPKRKATTILPLPFQDFITKQEDSSHEQLSSMPLERSSTPYSGKKKMSVLFGINFDISSFPAHDIMIYYSLLSTGGRQGLECIDDKEHEYEDLEDLEEFWNGASVVNTNNRKYDLPSASYLSSYFFDSMKNEDSQRSSVPHTSGPPEPLELPCLPRPLCSPCQRSAYKFNGCDSPPIKEITFYRDRPVSSQYFTPLPASQNTVPSSNMFYQQNSSALWQHFSEKQPFDKHTYKNYQHCYSSPTKRHRYSAFDNGPVSFNLDEVDCGSSNSHSHDSVQKVRHPVEPRRMLVKDWIASSDRPLVTTFTNAIVDELETTTFNEDDSQKRGDRSQDMIGFSGLTCRHCRGANGTGRYFLSSLESVSDKRQLFAIRTHLSKCIECPEEIMQNILQLEKNHDIEQKDKVKGSKKAFFGVIWEKLHPDAASTYPHSPRAVATCAKKDCNIAFPDIAPVY